MTETTEKLPLTSLDITRDRIAALRETFPEVFGEGKIDFDALKQTLGEAVDTGPERYGLSWAGKAGAIRNLQTPSIATLVPDREDSLDFDTTGNVFIEGENLEVLKLLQRAYYGKIKMIYIDPPYNTGHEFIYPDNFRDGLATYLRYSGQVDGDGVKLSTNTETSGRYHSNWLNMMYPRLVLARNLLREDGVIFVSIDDHEVHNLRLLMNEVFGEENFVAQITWKKRGGPPNDKVIGAVHEYVLLYARNGLEASLQLMPRSEESAARYLNLDNDPRGPWVAGDLSANAKGGRFVASLYYEIVNPQSGTRHLPPEGACWRFSKERVQTLIADSRITFGPSGNGRPKLKRFLSEVRAGETVPTLWDNLATNAHARSEINEIFGSNSVFETPKPIGLIKRMIEIVNGAGAVILDFFAGSCSTADAVLQLNRDDGGNRKFIMVQLPEPTDNPDFPTIADIGKERIRRVIAKLRQESAGQLPLDTTPQDLGFKVFKLAASNFRVWDATSAQTPEQFARQLELHIDHIEPKATQEGILTEILLKSGIELTAPVERTTVENTSCFDVADGLLLVCLEPAVTAAAIRGMIARAPQQLVCLDAAFHGNDQLKTNTVLQTRDAEIVFHTV